MLKKIFKRLRGDRGDSTIISAVIVVPLLAIMIITMLDACIYFPNRAIIQSTAQNGARTVAIMGGDGTAAQSTPLEKAYGLKMSNTCDKIKAGSRVIDAKKSTSTAIECNIMLNIQDTSSLSTVTVQSVVCTPNSTTSIGQRVSCEVKWKYGGLPGSAMSLINFSKQQVIKGSAEAEVNMTGIPLVKRS